MMAGKEVKIGDHTPPLALLELGQFYQRDQQVFCFRPECTNCSWESGCNKEKLLIKVGPGVNIRQSFCAQEGYLLAAIDYKQIEIRVAAQLSGDPVWVDAFETGQDLHCQMARIGWKIPDSVPDKEIPKKVRDTAKTCNFGNIFLGTAQTLSAQSTLTLPEAVEAHKIWWAVHPVYKQWTEEQKNFYRKNRYVHTFFGRRRKMDAMIDKAEEEQKKTGKKGGHKQGWGFCDRTSVNSPIQGSAADLMKLGMIRVYNWIIKEKVQDVVHQCLTVHDEMVLEVKNVPGVYEILREIGRQMILTPKGKKYPEIPKWRIPLGVDIEVGANWAEMRDINELDPDNKESLPIPLAPVREGCILVVPAITQDQAALLYSLIHKASLSDDGIKVPLKLQMGGKLYTSGTIEKVNEALLRKEITQIPGLKIQPLT
jgi:hypothetical protein